MFTAVSKTEMTGKLDSAVWPDTMHRSSIQGDSRHHSLLGTSGTAQDVPKRKQELVCFSGFWRSQYQPSGIAFPAIEEGMHEKKCRASLQPPQPHLVDHSFAFPEISNPLSRFLILFNYISASPLQERKILIFHSAGVSLRKQ